MVPEGANQRVLFGYSRVAAGAFRRMLYAHELEGGAIHLQLHQFQ
jgi:hypothetical protein